jgi:hypothetical protein
MGKEINPIKSNRIIGDRPRLNARIRWIHIASAPRLALKKTS